MNTLNTLILNLVLVFTGLFLSNSSFAQKQIDGVVISELGEPLVNVLISLSGTQEDQVLSQSDGSYRFTVPEDGNYSISACANADHLNGVSTLDMVLAARHINDVELLDSPYKIIAADVNLDNQLTGADTTLFWEVITGQVANFPDNRSWRFIESSYIFSDLTNPFSSTIPEEVVLNNLQNDTTINFIGLKIGDLNESSIIGGSITLGSGSDCGSTAVSNPVLLDAFADLKIFPNPFENEFNLDLGKLEKKAQIEVYSSSGILLSNSIHQNSQVIKLNLDMELAGLYFVKVIIADQTRWVSVVKN